MEIIFLWGHDEWRVNELKWVKYLLSALVYGSCPINLSSVSPHFLHTLSHSLALIFLFGERKRHSWMALWASDVGYPERGRYTKMGVGASLTTKASGSSHCGLGRQHVQWNVNLNWFLWAVESWSAKPHLQIEMSISIWLLWGQIYKDNRWQVPSTVPSTWYGGYLELAWKLIFPGISCFLCRDLACPSFMGPSQWTSGHSHPSLIAYKVK